jgi:pyruvate carboxylase
MRSAIAETRIAGVATNLPFLERILRDERYVANQVNTAFLPRLMDEAGLIAT